MGRQPSMRVGITSSSLLQEARESMAAVITNAILQSFIVFIIFSFFCHFEPQSYKKPQKETLGKARKSGAEGECLYLG